MRLHHQDEGAAVANYELAYWQGTGGCYSKACKEILKANSHEQFPVDMIQGGAGTTTNMNANEVIANRALELMGHQREYQYCSPNDHVNRSIYQWCLSHGYTSWHVLYPSQISETFQWIDRGFSEESHSVCHILSRWAYLIEDAVPATLADI